MQISAVKSGARVQSPPVQGSCNISAIEQNVIVTGILEDDSHADTCLVGRGFKVVNEHGHSAEVEGFTDRIGTIKLQVVDAITVAKTSEGEDVLLRVNHCLHQPDEERSLLSSFQVRHSGTRIDSTPMQHDDRSLFGIVLDTEKKGRVVIPFSLRGTSAGFMIRTPDDEDLDNLDVFDITSTLAWDPNSLEHAEEEARVQVQKDFTANERMFLTAEMPKDGEVHRVNLSSVWTRSTDALLLPALDEDETSTDESTTSSGDASRNTYRLRYPKIASRGKRAWPPQGGI